MVKERWKPVSENPSYYVSDQGRIKRNEKEIRQDTDRYGYPRVTISTKGIKHTRNTHQLVAKEFVEGYSEGLQVNHINGNKYDNRASNLEWISNGNNLRHAYKTGLNYGPPKKRVLIVETGEIFDSESACAKSINGHKSGVNGCLKGRRNTHKGFHFQYVEPDRILNNEERGG